MKLDHLNPQQKEAVLHTEGPLLILAGAGSGKTNVLTHRIAYLVEKCGIPPFNILGVTFTNKAAGEMKERVKNLIEDSSLSKNFTFLGTFHSICVRILKTDGEYIGLNSRFSIYDTQDQLEVVKEAMKELLINPKDFNPRGIQSFISSCKNQFVGPKEAGASAQGYFQETAATVYPKYQQILRNRNAVDFDDLLIKTVELLKNHPQILQKYQKRFQYILVDEYQDTNHVQYLLINALAGNHKNISVVGDDDQSIYSWRGATIQNILSFKKDYPDAKIVKLEQNYRSTPTILSAAYEVIRHNDQRMEKKLWTELEDAEKIKVYEAKNEYDEGDYVTDQIVDNNLKYKDTAVLYRTNAQSRILEESFLRAGIAYKIIGGLKFYERKEIKDALAYLRAVYNLDDDLSLKRIINTPSRKIGAVTIELIEKKSKELGISIARLLIDHEMSEINGNVANFAKLLQDFLAKTEKLKVHELIKYILEKSRYLDNLNDGTEESISRMENLEELISLASIFSELEPTEGLASFLEHVSLIEQEQIADDQKAGDNYVTLMTLHSAKGLEFENVFIVGMEEAIFPHSRSFTDVNEMEEERRLCYVGITRAKRNLHLSHAKSRTYYGSPQSNPRSRFIEDIPEKLIEFVRNADVSVVVSTKSDLRSLQKDSGWEDSWDDFDQTVDSFASNLKVGDKVKHEIFGQGKVVSLENKLIVVNFEIYGVKKLAADFAELTKI